MREKAGEGARAEGAYTESLSRARDPSEGARDTPVDAG